MKAATRGVLLGLAFVHTFPATKHLAAFYAQPSITEAWKGFGALFAIALYLLPTTLFVRALLALWRRSHALVTLLSATLIGVHLVPAWDHLPNFAIHPSWHDGWRGLSALLAMVWFALSIPLQAKVLSRVGSVARAIRTRERPPVLATTCRALRPARHAPRRPLPSSIGGR